jgi:hypothetical protein
MKPLVLSLLAVLVLGGCAHSRTGLGQSYVASGFSDEQATVIADDLADLLAGRFPPGRTSFHLQAVGENDVPGLKLDQALRSRGFTLMVEPSGDAPAVAYVLDRLDEGHCYARLTVAGGPTLARAYQIDGSLLEIQALAADEGR